MPPLYAHLQNGNVEPSFVRTCRCALALVDLIAVSHCHHENVTDTVIRRGC